MIKEQIAEGDGFIEAYNHFRDAVDLEAEGILPELNHLVWYMLIGIPEVPADRDSSPDAPSRAIEQRAAILKAVFVEVNRDQPDTFLDEGLSLYDQAAKRAMKLLKEDAVEGKPRTSP
ncbi:MAG: hypothetical protein JRK53_21450 [Deltaproteobacteria bacterium]|nr:hypothetical protein [Deltaproteobacteria bacterium]